MPRTAPKSTTALLTDAFHACLRKNKLDAADAFHLLASRLYRGADIPNLVEVLAEKDAYDEEG